MSVSQVTSLFRCPLFLPFSILFILPYTYNSQYCNMAARAKILAIPPPESSFLKAPYKVAHNRRLLPWLHRNLFNTKQVAELLYTPLLEFRKPFSANAIRRDNNSISPQMHDILRQATFGSELANDELFDLFLDTQPCVFWLCPKSWHQFLHDSVGMRRVSTCFFEPIVQKTKLRIITQHFLFWSIHRHEFIQILRQKLLIR
jgi:hypothetical protein